MSSDRPQVWWRASVLGAINGLLFGTTLEILREANNNYQGRLTTEHFESLGMSPPLAVDMLHWWAIPVWVTVFFIVASFFVHKYLRNRLKPLLVWQIIGTVAVTTWFVFFQLIAWQGGPPQERQAIANDVRILLSQGSFYNMITSRSILQDWLICLALVIVLNVIYGSVIQLSTTLYERKTSS